MSDQVVKKITEWPEVAPECDDPICLDDGCMLHGGAYVERTITLDGDEFKPGDQVDIRPNGEYFRAHFRIKTSEVLEAHQADFEALDLGQGQYFRIRREEPSGWESEAMDVSRVVPSWASKAMMISHVAQAFGLTPSEVYDRFGGMEPSHHNCRSQIIDNLGIEVQELPRPVDDDQGGYLVPDEYAEPLLEMMRRGEQPALRFSFMAGGALCTPTRSGMLTRRMDPVAHQLGEALTNFADALIEQIAPSMDRLNALIAKGMGDDDQESS